MVRPGGEPVVRLRGEPVVWSGGEPVAWSRGDAVVWPGGDAVVWSRWGPVVWPGGEPVVRSGGEPVVRLRWGPVVSSLALLNHRLQGCMPPACRDGGSSGFRYLKKIWMTRMATMFTTLIIGLMAGPLVSLYGSPTVSPVTEAA